MKLKALKYMRYAGKKVQAGDVFDATAADVRVLLAVKHAVLYVEPVVRAPVTKSIVKTADVEPVARKPVTKSLPDGGIPGNDPVQDEVPTVSNEPTVEAAKRHYKRRDLTAE